MPCKSCGMAYVSGLCKECRQWESRDGEMTDLEPLEWDDEDEEEEDDDGE